MTDVATTSGETTTEETGAAAAAADDTLLTGAAETGDTGTESDEAAAAAAEGAAAEGETDGDGDAGAEGSQTPPDAYADFTMPEGITLDEAALAEASPLFKELGLNQEQSQKVVDLYAKQVQAGSQKQVDDFNQLKSDWRNDSMKDDEFGGDNFEENVKVAQNAINQYGTPGLKQLLDDYGVGNHPEVVRFMVRVGQTLKEDVPGSAGSATSKEGDRVTRMYPNDS